METNNNNRFFTLETENRKQFFQVPKQFMQKNSKYYPMSSDAKLLYAILADRNSLSISNGWIDEYNRVYFIATIESLIDITGWGKQKTIKHLKELRTFNLLISKRKGQGMPSLHYLLQIEVEKELEIQEYQQKCENHTSTSAKIELLQVPKSSSNNTEYNNTEYNNISSSSNEDEEEVKKLLSICQLQEFKLSKKDIKALLLVYSFDKISKAIITASSTDSKIKNYKGYLVSVLNDIEKIKKVDITVNNKEFKKSNANFTQREQDMDELEKQLLGWEEQ